MSGNLFIVDAQDHSSRPLSGIDATPPGHEQHVWLRELLYGNPALLHVEGFGKAFVPLVAIGSGIETGCGELDNLFISAQGRLALVMIDALRPEGVNQPVDALLEHARRIAGWNYERLRELGNLTGNDFDVRLRAAMELAGISSTEFEMQLQSSLKQGSFLLLVAGSRISAEVLRRIDELHAAWGLTLMLAAVEIPFYRLGAPPLDTLLAAPQIIGPEQRAVELRAVLDTTLAMVQIGRERERSLAERSRMLAPLTYVPLTSFQHLESCRDFHDRMREAAVSWRTRLSRAKADVFVSELDERRARKLLQEHELKPGASAISGFPRSYDYVIFGVLIAATFGMILLAVDFKRLGDLTRPFWITLLGGVVGWVAEKGRWNYRATGAWGLSMLDLLIAALASLFAAVLFLGRILR